MTLSTTIVTKSFAAALAIGLGIVGGYNYVIEGSSNNFAPIPSPTSISSVSSTFSSSKDLLLDIPDPSQSESLPQTDADSPPCQAAHAEDATHESDPQAPSQIPAYEIDSVASEG